MRVRIKSWHPSPVTFPVTVERLNTSRLRVTEETGEHFTVNPGEHDYEHVPANVLDAIRAHHEPGGLMRINPLGAAASSSAVEVGGGEMAAPKGS